MYSCSAREKVPVSLVPSTSLSWQVGDQFAKIGRSFGTRCKSSNAAFLSASSTLTTSLSFSLQGLRQARLQPRGFVSFLVFRRDGPLFPRLIIPPSFRSAPPLTTPGCQQDAESTEERGASVVGSSSVQEGGDIFGTKAEWKEEKTRAPRPRPGPFYHRTPKTLTIFRSLEESPFYRCLPPSTLSIEEINASSASVCWRRQETPVRPLRVVLLAIRLGDSVFPKARLQSMQLKGNLETFPTKFQTKALRSFIVSPTSSSSSSHRFLACLEDLHRDNWREGGWLCGETQHRERREREERDVTGWEGCLFSRTRKSASPTLAPGRRAPRNSSPESDRAAPLLRNSIERGENRSASAAFARP